MELNGSMYMDGFYSFTFKNAGRNRDAFKCHDDMTYFWKFVGPVCGPHQKNAHLEPTVPDSSTRTS